MARAVRDTGSKEGGLAPRLVLQIVDPPVPVSPPAITGTLRAGGP